MKKNIKISISKRLLKAIEANIEGDSRNAKLETVIRKGYEILTSQNRKSL